MEGGKTSKSFWQSALVVNPYYFALLLFGMFFLNVYHIVSLDRGWTFSPIYFLFYALMESAIEVLFLMFIGNLIKTYLPKIFYYGFVSLCFLFFSLHYVDFILVRFMDISVFYGLHWIFDESLENFIELLHLTGISLGSWLFMLFGTLLLIPLIALILYQFTSKIALKKPIRVTHMGLMKCLCIMPLGLMTLDVTLTKKMKREEIHYYERVLPWKRGVLPQEALVIHFDKPFKTLEKEERVLEKVHLVPLATRAKPNIYLFIVESLRTDFITKETAANITSFREENLQFQKSYSNANCTQEAWYSIFHGKYPFHWVEAKKKRKLGSIPLQLLKKIGYQVHVYSAAQLRYYGMHEVMFGKKHSLVDSYNVYPHYFPTQAWQSDQKAIDTFLSDIDKEKAKEGNVFLFFIESTHFNYSWPKSYPTHFVPISEEKTHLRVSNSLKNIELIKNRYRNSIHYMDSLFGKVIDKLKEKDLYNDSVILFAGDHGEEFFEEGQLFHASHLSSMQTEPPIYMKLGNNQRAASLRMDQMVISQVDLFPTIFDYLLGEQPFDIFDGESIFKEERTPFVISGRFNGPRAPEEFFIHNEKSKCIFRFFGKQALEIRSFKDLSGNSLEVDKEAIYHQFSPIFKELFQ